jgi:signal recognition particle receptor subunit beta
MPVFNYPKKEVNVKVVYYGPGLSGKTTNLKKIHDGIKSDHRGKLVSLATQTDRTLFFDFMPLELGSLGGYKIRLHLYTVPGQVHYNATRKLVLKGVDGIVFVADSQKAMADANLESVLNLEKNLQSYGKSLGELPHVIQANKRDLDEAISMEELTSLLNHHGAVMTEAVASDGKGVLETLTEIVRLAMRGLRDQFAGGMGGVAGPSPESSSAKATGDRSEPKSPEADHTPSPAENGIEALESELEPAPEPPPEPDLDLEAEPESSFVSTVASLAADRSMEEEAMEDKPEPVPPAPSLVEENHANGVIEEPATGSPIKVLVPVEGLGTLELSININARMLEREEGRSLEVDVSGAALGVSEPERQPEPVLPEIGNQPSVIGKVEPETESEPEPEPQSGPEVDLIAIQEAPENTLSMDGELAPLEDAPNEPLGAPLDGQEHDDLRIPDLPQEEKVILKEDLDTASAGMSSPEPASEYDPTAPSLEFDFPDTETEEEEPKKTGLFGRFKKK